MLILERRRHLQTVKIPICTLARTIDPDWPKLPVSMPRQLQMLKRAGERSVPLIQSIRSHTDPVEVDRHQTTTCIGIATHHKASHLFDIAIIVVALPIL